MVGLILMRKTNKLCSAGKNKVRKNIIGFLFLFLLGLVPSATFAQELNVAVASNFYHALSIISHQFEQETGITVKLSSGASGLLYAQVVRGAPFDLFFSADIERPELLEQKGLTSARNTYVYGRLALWVPKISFHNNSFEYKRVVDEAFLTDFEQRLAIANPRLAPYGKAAEQTLEHLGLSQRFSSKLILGNNINQTYQFIDSGNVLAGFVAYSLLKNKAKDKTEKAAQNSVNKDKTDYWLVPESFHQPIAQQVVLLKNSKNKDAAQALLEFILSDPIQEKLLKMGYSGVESTVRKDVING